MSPGTRTIGRPSIAPMHQRGITSWRVRVRPHTQTQPDSTIIASHPLLTTTPTRTTIVRGVSCREAPTCHARCVVGCACRCSQFQVIAGEAEPGCIPSPRLRQLGPQSTGGGRASTAESDVGAIAPFSLFSRIPPPNQPWGGSVWRPADS